MVLNYESRQKWYVPHSDSYIKCTQRTPEGEGFSVEVVYVSSVEVSGSTLYLTVIFLRVSSVFSLLQKGFHYIF